MDAFNAKVATEARRIFDSEFWKMYRAAIEKKLREHEHLLKSSPLDRIVRVQGYVAALEYVKWLPDELLKQLTGEPSETAPKE